MHHTKGSARFHWAYYATAERSERFNFDPTGPPGRVREPVDVGTLETPGLVTDPAPHRPRGLVISVELIGIAHVAPSSSTRCSLAWVQISDSSPPLVQRCPRRASSWRQQVSKDLGRPMGKRPCPPQRIYTPPRIFPRISSSRHPKNK